MSSLLCRKHDPSSRHHFAFTICEIEMNVVVAMLETWVAYLLDIVVRLLYVKTGINVSVAVQETRPRSWGSCAYSSPSTWRRRSCRAPRRTGCSSVSSPSTSSPTSSSPSSTVSPSTSTPKRKILAPHF